MCIVKDSNGSISEGVNFPKTLAKTIFLAHCPRAGDRPPHDNNRILILFDSGEEVSQHPPGLVVFLGSSIGV
jgi:hypothetical protein